MYAHTHIHKAVTFKPLFFTLNFLIKCANPKTFLNWLHCNSKIYTVTSFQELHLIWKSSKMKEKPLEWLTILFLQQSFKSWIVINLTIQLVIIIRFYCCINRKCKLLISKCRGSLRKTMEWNSEKWSSDVESHRGDVKEARKFAICFASGDCPAT